ncbi:ABC transporter permease [Natrialbaceae archaeon AArc-T1-2]|uniref:ABC transporter permease n=1 Tax=Natrialbaceae archaeon AArc-T1-2 TaxID=3053904 RepID=UPI00255AFFBF|nr:ABC transporter permease [Natrialbaceae archaeon AArc-T1-2]WIV68851.1 ABC transporter permease [Natrialbaceae archaeon AArc-T1-2]
MTLRNRLARWLGLIRVGVRQTITRATHTARKRVLFSILGVAVAIGLLVVVTGVGIGLATGTTVYDDDIDYWIVPEDDGDRSPLVATDGPQFGAVHETTETLQARDDVQSATPVLTQVMRLESEDSDEYVLVVGIINSPGMDRVSGIATDGLSTGDPYHADGEWTGEVVLSRGAAELLETSAGDPMTVGGNESFTVAAVDDGDGENVGNIPTALVQLGELQVLTGASEHDQADQFVVQTDSPEVSDDLEELYPQSAVHSRAGLTASQTIDSDLPLALALTAFVVAVSIGTLFVITTTGLELVADRKQLATMAAIGLSTHSQLRLVGVQTLVMSVLGGVVGAVGGLAGIALVNTVAVRTITTEPIAVSHPVFLVYGVLVAILIGLLSLPYLLVLTRRLSGGVP